MGIGDWLIVLLPLGAVIMMAAHSRRYIRGVADFISAGRVCGRYVIGTTELTAGIAVLTLVAQTEVNYMTGFAMNFWNGVLGPLMLVLSLNGFCVYRFRETRAMSIGQFIEMRYSHGLRIFASGLRTSAEMITNTIVPAVSARFFIYFLGFPHRIELFGLSIPTYAAVMFAVLLVAIAIIWFGGQLALTITDTLQCLLCYPMIVLFVIYILCRFSWTREVVPMMLDRAPGESFLNPFDISKLRDFNLFALGVLAFSTVINRANWIGTGTSTAARSPHEQKMAGVLGGWRYSLVIVFYMLFSVAVMTTLNHADFAGSGREIKSAISSRVAEEIVSDRSTRESLIAATTAIPEIRHRIGVDAPLSQQNNLDTPYLDAAQRVLGKDGEGNAKFQEFRTLYRQLMLPMTFRHLLPPGMLGLFCLLMAMLMISTDDGRIFSSAVTLTQDIVLPLRKKGLSPEQHIRLLRWISVGVGIFFFIGAFFMSQLDYINLFVQIVTAIWSGGAGSMLVFGLYSRRGTTAGAYAALISGAAVSIGGVLMQRNWADMIYPWLAGMGWIDPLDKLLETLTIPLEPWVVWRMDAVKFPINSVEMFFLAMILSMGMYWVVSLVTCRKPFNLDRMLHRGIYDVEKEKSTVSNHGALRGLLNRLLGITPEYTAGDRVIAWGVFLYSIIFSFAASFVGVLVWNLISPWSPTSWGNYFLWVWLVVPGVVAAVTTVWFSIGGIIDLRQMFVDLSTRCADALDDGRIEGGVLLSEQKKMDAVEQKYTSEKESGD